MEVKIVRRQVIKDYSAKQRTFIIDNIIKDYVVLYTLLIDNIKHQYVVDYINERSALMPTEITKGTYSVDITSKKANDIIYSYSIPAIIDINKDEPEKAIERYQKLILLK